MASNGASDPRLDAWVAGQPQLRQLAEAIALSKGFQFDVVVSDDLRLSDAALRLIERTVLERRVSKCVVHYLTAPGRDQFERSPFEARTLLDAIVTPLLAASPPAEDEATIWFLDTLGSRDSDMPAWRSVFRRLNENRNRIAEGLQSPLIVCVSSALRAALIDEAPDLWSVRSAVAALDHERFLGRVELQSFSRTKYSAEDTDLAPTNLRSAREQVTAIRARVAAAHDAVPQRLVLAEALRQVGRAEAATGHAQSAVDALEEALSILSDIQNSSEPAEARGTLSASTARSLAITLETLGQTSRARSVLLGALDLIEQQMERSPASSELLREHASLLGTIGDFEFMLGRYDQARACHESALTQFSRLAEMAPERAELQRDLSISYSQLGDVLASIGLWEQSQAAHERSVEVIDRLLQAEPNKVEYQFDLAASNERLGDVLRSQGKFDAARDCYGRSLALRSRLVEIEPGRLDYLNDLASSHSRIGTLLASLGGLEQAREHYTYSLEIAERLAIADPKRSDYQRNLAVAYDHVAGLMHLVGQHNEALLLYERALSVRLRLAEQEPTRSGFRRELAVSYAHRGDVLRALGSNDQAVADYVNAQRILELLLKSDPDKVELQRDLVVLLVRLAQVHSRPLEIQHALSTLYALRDSGRLAPADAGMIQAAEALRDQLAKSAPPPAASG